MPPINTNSKRHHHHHHHHHGVSTANASSSNTTNNKALVRTGPLCLGAVLFIVVPFVVITFLSTALEKDQNVRFHTERVLDEHHWKSSKNIKNDNKINNRFHRMTSPSNNNHNIQQQQLPNQQQQFQGQDSSPSFSSSSSFLIQHRQIVAETQTAKCEVVQQSSSHEQDSAGNGQNNFLMWHEQDVVHVLLLMVDGNNQGQILLSSNDKQQSFYPLHAYIEKDESPWQAAQRLAATTKLNGISELGGTIPVVIDKQGLKDGNVLPNTDWVFLGRHVGHLERGGGLLYSYLYQITNDDENNNNDNDKNGYSGFPKSVFSNGKNLISLSQSEIVESLLQGRFGDVRGATTMSLALAHIGFS